jgi:hypothetical protein
MPFILRGRSLAGIAHTGAQTPVASQATVAPRVSLEREEEQGVGVEPKDL